MLFNAVKADSADNTKNYNIPAETPAPVVKETAITAESVANTLYDSLRLRTMGMNKQALVYAIKGQYELADNGKVPNEDILTVVDFSQSSNKKRMYILDLKNFKVLVNTYVAHGKNSGIKNAERFSNTHESLQSSLGFYVTKGTYFGKHGLSLRLAGLEKGFNDNAESRAVVVHGANYIGDHRLGAPYMGRSFGCPAVPQAVSAKVINLIKDGTTLFIYHPTQKYLHGSTLLNG
jgi:hypothetical protein